MSKRQLTEKEKELCRGSIKRLSRENENAKYLLQLEELKIEKGLKLSYEANLINAENKLKNYKQTIDQNNKQIKILEEQIQKGVERKKNPIVD